MQDIENQKMAAMVDLKNQAGQMAIEIAEKIIRKDLAGNADQVAYAKSLADAIKLN
jgi:F-type H+-transporting ATPase subunit b